MATETLVSVVIPCYNHARYLGEALRSIGSQTFPRAEVIVVDDGSTDGPDAVCRAFPGVRYLRRERGGPSAARNQGAEASTGDFLVFLDADDYLYPNALEVNLYYLGYYPEAAYVSGGHHRIDVRGRILESPEPLARAGDNYLALLQGNYIGMEGTVMYRRAAFFPYAFDPTLRACEDYDLNLRIARDLPVYAHAHRIAAYRIHGGNRSRELAGAARVVLQRQEPGLRTEAERACYEKGLENWRRYYRRRWF